MIRGLAGVICSALFQLIFDMDKTISITFSVTIEGDKINGAMQLNNIETLDDIIQVFYCAEAVSTGVKEQIKKYAEINGDIHQSQWQNIPAADVLTL